MPSKSKTFNKHKSKHDNYHHEKHDNNNECECKEGKLMKVKLFKLKFPDNTDCLDCKTGFPAIVCITPIKKH